MPEIVSETRSVSSAEYSIDFRVAIDRLNEPAYFVLGFRKSGSTMLGSMVKFLATQTSHNVIDWPGSFFRNGLAVKDWMQLSFEGIMAGGNVYSGFRTMPSNVVDSKVFKAARKVLLVRDPRDVLVSQYFSDQSSHKLPSPDGLSDRGRNEFLAKRKEALETQIDKYVMDRANGIGRGMLEYSDLLRDETCLVMKYEVVIFQKRWMVRKLLNHFGWSVHPGAVEKLMDRVDVVPGSEDQKKFIRKVVPGDHREKLEPATIKALNKRLEKVLELFDYV